MSADGTFFARILIMAYAAGVVALGAHEIHERHGKARATEGEKANLIRDLVGATNIERGRFELQKPPEEDVKKSEISDLGKLIDAFNAKEGQK